MLTFGIAAACGGGDGGGGGVTEGSLAAWLEIGNGGEEPGCPVLSRASLGAESSDAEVSWVGNADDNLICIVALPEGSGGLAIYAPEGIVPAAEVVPEESPGWGLQSDEPVVLTDETLAGGTRFVVVADAAVQEEIEDIGAAMRANLGRSPDSVDALT